MAANLSSAILNQDDPETVRDGAPAFLLMLDSFVAGSPDDPAMLRAAAELYAAYGIVFVDDPERARRLTSRSRNYGRQALCAGNGKTCDLWQKPFEEFASGLLATGANDTQALYTTGLSWLAYIQAHRDDWSALAELPYAEATLMRVRDLDTLTRAASTLNGPSLFPTAWTSVSRWITPTTMHGRFMIANYMTSCSTKSWRRSRSNPVAPCSTCLPGAMRGPCWIPPMIISDGREGLS
jgi:hypothetical protein